jgi:hypothetical protein
MNQEQNGVAEEIKEGEGIESQVSVETAGQDLETGDLKFKASLHLQPIQLSTKSNEHYTPSDIVERARWLMGSIDLDPASCIEAQKTVQAGYFITRETDVSSSARRLTGDGLQLRPWRGNVFLNPPGGSFKVLNKGFSNAALWWAALVQDWLRGEMKQAIFIGFSLEILRHSQNGCPLPVQAFHRCYPKKRIKFSGAPQPTHANVIVYLPPVRAGEPNEYHFTRFREAFGPLGICEPACEGLSAGTTL